MTTRTTLMAAALIAAVARPAAGQVASLPVGARLRVTTTTSNTPIVGKLVARISDTVHIAGIVALGVSPADQVAALSQVRAIDRSTRSRNHGVIGMFVGAAIGLIGGKIAARTFHCDGTTCESDATGGFDSSLAQSVVLLVTSLGVGIGAYIGHSIVKDTWQPVSLDRSGPADARPPIP